MSLRAPQSVSGGTTEQQAPEQLGRRGRHNVILCLNLVIAVLAPVPFGAAFLLPLAAGVFLTSGTRWFRICVVTTSLAIATLGIGTGLIATFA